MKKSDKRITSTEPPRQLGSTEPHATRPERYSYKILLQEIVDILNRAHPPKDRNWYTRVYVALQQFARYVAIPSIIIAAVFPVYELGKKGLDILHKDHIQEKYVEYAELLLRDGHTIRAKDILDQFTLNKELNINYQYTRAKILAFEAIKRGENLQEAQDTINIILLLTDNTPMWFVHTISELDIWKLRLALVDIDIENGRQTKARTRLRALSAPDLGAYTKWLEREVSLRFAIIDILQYKYREAEQKLSPIVDELDKDVSKYRGNESILFQYAKSLLFQRRIAEALDYHMKLAELYRDTGDDFGLLKVYTNIGVGYYWEKNWPSAQRYYQQAEILARRVNSKRDLARVLANLALIEKDFGNLDKSLELCLEALPAFREAGNILGVSTISNTIADIYLKKNELPEAMRFAKTAIGGFEELGEIRGLSRAFVELRRIYSRMGMHGEEIVAAFQAYVFSRHIKDEENTIAIENIIRRLRNEVGDEEFKRKLEHGRKKLATMLTRMGRTDIDIDVTME